AVCAAPRAAPPPPPPPHHTPPGGFPPPGPPPPPPAPLPPCSPSPRPPPGPAMRRTRLRVLRLEDRVTPHSIVWTGGADGRGTNWLDPSNWVDADIDSHPHVLPGPSDDAVIPDGTAVGGDPVIVLAASTSVASVH